MWLKTTEHTTSSINPNISYQLWVATICQCGYTTNMLSQWSKMWEKKEAGSISVGADAIWERLIPCT